MSEQEVLDIIRQAVDRAGSQKAFAELCGVSAPYLSDVLKGNRSPGERILNQLGIKKFTDYEYIRKDEE